MDLLKQLQTKSDVRMAVGKLWVSSTEASSEDREQGGAAGGMDAALGAPEKRTGEGAARNCDAALCWDISPEECPMAVRSGVAGSCWDSWVGLPCLPMLGCTIGRKRHHRTKWWRHLVQLCYIKLPCPVNLAALPDPISVWQKVKQAAIVSGSYKGAEKIDVPMLGSWELEKGTTAVYPIVRGSENLPDKYIPFQWPVLSELCQLVVKHKLGLPAVANTLCFLTTEGVTPCDIMQLAKLMFTTVQYMVFESAWKSSAEKQELKNLKVPWEDPLNEAEVP